ncbi:Clp protease N-terminal domain-containing protein [Actinomadura violacea]|uniref:AAA family ATPase n=1 Tax=Actinomadura violacea TaxID=2819934 RepID=A0ABS3RS31_9ACTN|nr:Clp protease N-terminal domain-containing protein [Actinomadura violacea]MBO2459113.1 AAA family ATPase [Actinomadura violacea]
MFEKFTDRARRVVVLAQEEARLLRHEHMGTEHLLLALVAEGESIPAQVLADEAADLPSLRRTVAALVGEGAESSPEHLPFTPRAKNALNSGNQESLQRGLSYIGTEHILLGLLNVVEDPACTATRVLAALDAEPRRIRRHVMRAMGYPMESTVADVPAPPPPLHGYARDLTQEARDGLGPLVDRRAEIDAVLRVLSRRTRSNPLLVGPPGVGKTSVVTGLAVRIASGAVPQRLKAARVFALDLPRLVAGTRDEAQVAERLTTVIAEAGTRRSLVLYVDDLPELLGIAGAGGLLRVALAEGRLRLIGEATPGGLPSVAEHPGLMRCFEAVTVPEPSATTTLEILQGLRGSMERHYGLTITDAAVRAAADSAGTRLPGRFLPEGAIWLIDEASSRARVERAVGAPQLTEFRRRLADVRAVKEREIEAQHFEEAARLRDEETALVADMTEHEEQWRSGELHLEVTEEDVEAVTAQLGSAASPRPDVPAVPSASRQPVEHDPEVWLLS